MIYAIKIFGKVNKDRFELNHSTIYVILKSFMDKIFKKIASYGILYEMKMIGSHDSNQRGFIIKIMFCINVCFFCEHETANTKIAFVCGHITCHLKLVKLHEYFSLGSYSYENAFFTRVPSSIKLDKSFRLHATRIALMFYFT